MTTTESTIINFTTLDIIHKIKRANLQNKIVSNEHDKHVFPRSGFLRNSEELADTDVLFPSFREITNIIREAEEEAITFASLLGMFKEDTCYTTVCTAE
jgi:hypothetical protein